MHKKGTRRFQTPHTRWRGGQQAGWGACFTAALEECALLDTAWLTEKSYKTKRVHSVMGSDTKGRKQRGGAYKAWNAPRRTKVQTMGGTGGLTHHPSKWPQMPGGAELWGAAQWRTGKCSFSEYDTSPSLVLCGRASSS